MAELHLESKAKACGRLVGVFQKSEASWVSFNLVGLIPELAAVSVNPNDKRPTRNS